MKKSSAYDQYHSPPVTGFATILVGLMATHANAPSAAMGAKAIRSRAANLPVERIGKDAMDNLLNPDVAGVGVCAGRVMPKRTAQTGSAD